MPTYEVRFDGPERAIDGDIVIRLDDGSEVVGHIIRRVPDEDVQGHGRVVPLPEGSYEDASLIGRDPAEGEVQGHGPLDIGPKT
jgi:hypothetical protein